MKKYIIITLLSFSGFNYAHAQDYKINKTSGKMTLNLSSVTVEGYNGNQIIFSSSKKETAIDPRAKGLHAINGSGYTDNTGLGISVTESGSNIEVHQVAIPTSEIKILVPKGVSVSFICHSVINAGKVRFMNLENEIEVSTDYNKIELENITGPATVRTLHGDVGARFNAPVRGPVSIVAVFAAIDVTIPATTKANLKLSTSHGEILAASDLKIDIEKSVEGEMIRYGSAVNGKLNGGGADFKLNSEYGKIYLRRKN
jgi:hypothetical protein